LLESLVWFQKSLYKHCGSVCALARIQHAGSGDLSGRVTTEILAQRRNKEVEMEFLTIEVSEFFSLLWSACHRTMYKSFCATSIAVNGSIVDSSQRISFPRKNADRLKTFGIKLGSDAT